MCSRVSRGRSGGGVGLGVPDCACTGGDGFERLSLGAQLVLGQPSPPVHNVV